MVAKDKVFDDLVREHFSLEQELERIVWLPEGESASEIRLLHVDASSLPSSDVQVFSFAPTPEIPYRLRLAQITPAEWLAILARQLALPEGWSLGDRREVQRNGAG